MKTRTLMTAALAAATLTACGTSETTATNTTTVATNTAAPEPASSPTAAASTPAAAGDVQIAGDGLVVAGKPIAFGTARAAALTAISTGMGGKPDKQEKLEDCGPGPLDSASWNKGLEVYFQEDKLVGWSGAVDLKTAEGIGFGSTRAAVEKAYHPRIEQSSLGTEFGTDDGLSGTFESDAKDASVSDVWAGMTCVMR